MTRQSAIGRLPLHDVLMWRNSDANRIRSATLNSMALRCSSAIRHTSEQEGAFSEDNRSSSRT